MSQPVPPPDLRDLTRDDLSSLHEKQQIPSFRTDQVLDWLYKKRVEKIQDMSNLPASLREMMATTTTLHIPRVEKVQGSRDTTQKFLLRLQDDQLVETVLIPASPGLYGDRADRLTLCLSTQVGCAYGCKFCASGLDGFRRNLKPHEIIGEFLAAEKASGGKVNNLVFMGMGEPLANYDNLLQAIRIINAPWGLGIGARKITISTSGLAPQIRKLAADPLQVRLAISLHGAQDDVRNKIMPINKKFPLGELMAACDDYRKIKGRLITFEYILLAGVNDALTEVPHLARLARRAHAKVNLIPFNEVEGTGFKRPDDDHCRQFNKALAGMNVTTTLRLEKGHDIDAACGQLRLREIQSSTP